MKVIPKDFLRALRQSGLDEFFVACPYVPRADYLSWIASAKRPATRQQRIRKAVVKLFAQWTEEMNTARAAFVTSDSVRLVARPVPRAAEPMQRTA